MDDCVGRRGHIRHNGELHTVTAIEGSLVTFRSRHGRAWVADARHVLADESTVIGANPDFGSPPDGVGQLLANLTDVENDELAERAAHMRELLTGYRSGSVERAGPGEPRPEFGPERPDGGAPAGEGGRAGRRAAKRAALAGQIPGRGAGGVGRRPPSTGEGPAAGLGPAMGRLLPGGPRRARRRQPADRQDHLGTRRGRLDQAHGAGVVPVPYRRRAYEALAELTRGTNALRGATKQKRSIALAPAGHLRPAAADAARRVPAVGHHPPGRLRHGTVDAALGVGRVDHRS